MRIDNCRLTVRALFAPLAVLAMLAPFTLRAQSLPDARAVLARYAAASGAVKYALLAGYRLKGTFEIRAQGLSGPVEEFVDGAGREVQVMTIPGIGEMKEGTDTAFAWSMNPMEGPRLLDAKEFAERREQLDPKAMQRDPAVVVSAQTIERATVDSQPCVKLKLKWKSGRETTECYSEQTGLLVSKEGVETSSMGDIAVVTSYSEHKTFDGITMPMKTVQRAAGIEFVVRVTEVVFGPVDPAKLAIPPEIQALRKK